MATSWGVYDARTGLRIGEPPRRALDHLLDREVWLATSTPWWDPVPRIISTDQADLREVYANGEAYSAALDSLVQPVEIRPDGVTEYQVRVRSNSPAVTPTDQLVSRHGRYDLAAAAVRAQAREFRSANPGGYGYRWDITDQEGREVLLPWHDE